MPVLATTQSIYFAIPDVYRSYDVAWDSEYEKEIAQGNTQVRKSILDDGNSLLKTQHSETKQGIERHVISLRDKHVSGDDAGSMEQVQIVITHPADNPGSQEKARQVAFALCAKCTEADFLGSLVGGSL
jgi:hypothetical protein